MVTSAAPQLRLSILHMFLNTTGEYAISVLPPTDWLSLFLINPKAARQQGPSI